MTVFFYHFHVLLVNLKYKYTVKKTVDRHFHYLLVNLKYKYTVKKPIDRHFDCLLVNLKYKEVVKNDSLWSFHFTVRRHLDAFFINLEC